MTAADSPLSAEGAQLLRNARRIVVKAVSYTHLTLPTKRIV